MTGETVAPDVNVVIDADGNMTFIYSDDLAGLLDGGAAKVTRASHVEPALGGGWQADMRPSGGPILFRGGVEVDGDTLDFREKNGPYLKGYNSRREALAAEVAWLRQNRGL